MSEYSPSGSASKDTKPKEPECSENRMSKEYAYIMANAQGTATILNFNSVRVLEGGFTTEKYKETLDELSAIILSAPTLENLGSTAFYFEKNNGLPVLSHTGTLSKVVKSRSGTMFKRIQETAPKSIFGIPIFNPKYDPYIIHQDNKGILSMYVLAGTKQEGETIAKGLSAEKEEDVIKYASQSGMVAVLLWRPNIASKAVVRVLLSGTCSSLRIQESLDKAYKFLPFLDAPTVKSSDAFKKTAVPAVPRFVRNSNVAIPTKPVVTAPRQSSTSTGRIAPSLAGFARASSKSSTVSAKGEKPQMSRNVQMSSRISASAKAQTVGAVTKTVPTNAGAFRSRVTPGNPVVKRSQPGVQKQPIASKRPTTRAEVPVTKKSSNPQSIAQPARPSHQNTASRIHGETILLGDSTLESVEESSITSEPTVAPQILGDTIQLDSTLKSLDQSSKISMPTVDKADTSIEEIFKPIRDRTSPATLGSMNVSEVVAETKPLDLNENAAKPIETENIQVIEPTPGNEVQKMNEITAVAEGIVKLIVDAALLHQGKNDEEEKSDLSEDATGSSPLISTTLDEEASVESSVKQEKFDRETSDDVDSFSTSQEEPTLPSEVEDVVEDILNQAIRLSLASTRTDAPIEHEVLRMQANRRLPPAHKSVKFARPYYFDLVKMPRDKNSMVPENILGFVSMIRSKYMILPTENVSELQLHSIINGHKSGHPCTIIPTHTSDNLTNFLAKNQSRFTDAHISFETPLNNPEAEGVNEFDKRKISFI